jgi:prepilin-type N-terminal cleavage/methylation domain-containing protein
MPSASRIGFTLTEILIVVVIIAVIMAIAVPNFFSYRQASNDARAAATLKSNIGPAETIFQNGAKSDLDSDSVGEYARDYQYLAGVTVSSAAELGKTVTAVEQLDSSFRAPDGGVNPSTNHLPGDGSFRYRIDINLDVTTHADTNGNWPASATNPTYRDAERYFAAYAWPNTTNEGSRCFAISAEGNVFATRQGYPASKLTNGTSIAGGLALDGTGAWVNTYSIFISDPRSNPGSVNTQPQLPTYPQGMAAPYVRN